MYRFLFQPSTPNRCLNSVGLLAQVVFLDLVGFLNWLELLGFLAGLIGFSILNPGPLGMSILVLFGGGSRRVNLGVCVCVCVCVCVLFVACFLQDR